MADKIIISLLYILPIVGISYTLFKYSIVQFYVSRNRTIGIKLLKSTRIRAIFSFFGGISASTLGLIWLYMIWVPSIHFPLIAKIIFFILLIPFGCCLAAIGSLTKVVEYGAGSATSVFNGLKGMASKKPIDRND